MSTKKCGGTTAKGTGYEELEVVSLWYAERERPLLVGCHHRFRWVGDLWYFCERCFGWRRGTFNM